MGDNEKYLLLLAKSGLGFSSQETIPHLSAKQLEDIFNLAQEQTVVGLALDGIDANGIKSPKGSSVILEWIGLAAQIAGINETQFRTVGEVCNLFASKQLPPVVMKGPVVAQEYPNPLRRTSGDIDLYFTPELGKKAVELAKKLKFGVFEESERDISFTYKNNLIEIHPYVSHQALQEKYICDQRFQKWCEDQIMNHYRTTTIGSDYTEIRIPSVMMTMVYGFYHLWIHFVRSGIGLRHICDWMICLHNYHGKYDVEELQALLQEFGLLGPWKGFSGVAVDYLGLPKNEMPFYHKSNKAERILNVIFKEGNFGHKKENIVLPDARLPRLIQTIKYIISRYWIVGRIFPKDVMNFLPGPITLINKISK